MTKPSKPSTPHTTRTPRAQALTPTALARVTGGCTNENLTEVTIKP